MGPKSFVTCYICSKEFGSRSITFHEQKCLEKWRISNKNLPAEKRASTPERPAGWKYSQISFWICSHCQVTVPFAKKNQHVSVCSARKLLSNNRIRNKSHMTGVVKADFSPKKGKENKNISNHIPTLSVGRKNAKNEAKTSSDTSNGAKAENLVVNKEQNDQNNNVKNVTPEEHSVASNSTSKRSLRPQTKVLRRPTPNLNHPVIQVDSDDSSGDSSCSDKGKEDNPKRLKMASDSSDSLHKPKNFIMYNKYNVDKNTKHANKERASAMIAAIPNPCNSCNRSQQPERLHSHAKKDARGLMNRRSPSLDVKMTSPQKKSPETLEKIKVKSKEAKTRSTSADNVEDKPISEMKQKLSKSKENLSKVPSESCLVTAVSEAEKKDILEPLKPCYICLENIKISSLLLHESQCLASWKKTNNSLTPNLRKLPPRRPEEDEMPTSDEADPAWTSVQSQLIPCPLCTRTFFPERLPVHRRVCKGKSSQRPLKRASSMREQSASSRNGEEQRAAVYVPCYICGRSYGSWVISMHEQQCLRKWRRENDKLPDDEQQEEPQRDSDGSPDDDMTSIIELGDNAWENHLQQLVPCPLCSRTFFPNRLAVHKRSCKGPSSNTQRPKSNKGT
ncbi:zinc finger protein 474 [Parasteatoda tepidariorum]|uniref:zinc finger protein 474 n=1 Tax=Parasteatoda tepidariorum TaxID=114398 RepID=UPI001C722766|nr:muscle M-line assembly protein unc-89 [Parasteatoda tepidariorum]XP_015906598.2 muscle M-line assembly protein unc-89 [Parasteatoda tepidariorum]